MVPLRAIIRISVRAWYLSHTLTLIGVLINCAAGWLSRGIISRWPVSS